MKPAYANTSKQINKHMAASLPLKNKLSSTYKLPLKQLTNE
ncbi:MAG TPA: hypothetical protein VIQ77_02010 [Mucilaginibacter sp.]